MIKDINSKINLAGNLDSEAATFIASYSFKRPNFHSPITETDLENYVVESVWKSFDKSRLELASKLGVSEFDLILKDAHIMGFKIDGHKILNPEGFTAKTFEVVALVTIARKSLGFFKSASAIEEGSIRAYMLHEKSKRNNLIYVESGESSTKVFVVTSKKTAKVNEIKWGREDVINAIGDSLGSDKAISMAIYSRLINGDLSAAILEKLDKVFTATLRDFIVNLSEAVKSVKDLDRSEIDSIFIRIFATPSFAHDRKFLFNNKRARMIRVEENADTAAFLSDKNKCYERYNDIARTRVKWLAPANA